MVTGASTADLAIVLVDARNGVVAQSKRHAFIASLLGIPHIVVAVNKMDLVGYDEGVFEGIVEDFGDFAARLDVNDVTTIPISALRRRQRGRSLGGHALVQGPVAAATTSSTSTSPRPQPARRPLPGAVGDPPRGRRRPRLPRLRRPGGGRRAAARRRGRRPALGRAHAGRRDRRLRGSARARVPADVGDAPPRGRHRRLARRRDLRRRRRARTGARGDRRRVLDGRRAPCAPARATRSSTPRARPARDRGRGRPPHRRPHARARRARRARLNDIGRVHLRIGGPLVVDVYADNRTTGSFILIDEASNDTVGAGMVVSSAS